MSKFAQPNPVPSTESFFELVSGKSPLSGRRQVYAVRQLPKSDEFHGDIVEVSDEYEGSPRRWFRRHVWEVRPQWRRRVGMGWMDRKVNL